MTLTLDLPPSVEQAYITEAAARGLALDAFVREVLLSHALFWPHEQTSAEDWVKQFREWTQSHGENDLPVLSDEAMSREFIYGERGL